MTVKNDTDAEGIKMFCRRYTLLATLALGASVVPLVSSSASAAPVGISPASTAPVVSYGGGLATTVVDENQDVLLFTQASGATTWAKKTIAPAINGEEYFDPQISSNGDGDLVIVAKDVSGHLESWSGSVGGRFHQVLVSSASSYSTPSVAYSPAAGNFVIAATDSSDNVDFWYQSAGSWASELVQSGQFVHFLAAVVAVTDTGVLVLATDDQEELDAYYQPLAASGWTSTSVAPGGYIDLSAVWSGADVLVATDQAGVQSGDQSLKVISYSDKGVFASNTTLGETSTTDLLAGTAIAWSGFNAVVTSLNAHGDSTLNFFYSDSSFAFHEETVATGNAHRGYSFFPGIAVANSSIEITDVSDAALYGFSQAIGGSGWPHEVIAR